MTIDTIIFLLRVKREKTEIIAFNFLIFIIFIIIKFKSQKKNPLSMNYLPQSLQKLISWFQNLPWVWEKTAQRFAFNLIKNNKDFLKDFWNTLWSVKDNLKECESCCNFSEKPLCLICENPIRKREQICIIENPFDIISMEKPWIYKWLYHVLHGILSPIDWVNPSDIRIDSLLKRIESWNIEEIIFAINPTLEWEATNMYIFQKIKDKKIKTTMLARGLSIWWDLEYTDELTIIKALEARVPF